MLCPFYPFLHVFRRFFLIFDFFVRQLFLTNAPAVLGRRDGSIRALRKVRIRNEIDNFIESMSQMVPRGPRWSELIKPHPRDSGYNVE